MDRKRVSGTYDWLPAVLKPILDSASDIVGFDASNLSDNLFKIANPLLQSSLLSRLLEIKRDTDKSYQFTKEHGENALSELSAAVRILTAQLSMNDNDEEQEGGALVEADIDEKPAAEAGIPAEEAEDAVLARLNAALAKPEVDEEDVKNAKTSVFANPFRAVTPMWYEMHALYNLDKDLPAYFESPPVSVIPNAASQEFFLVEDVVFALAGFSGRYIVIDSRGKFVLSEFVDTAAKENVARMLPLCEMHVEVQHWVERSQCFEQGATSHAAGTYIRGLLADYLASIARLEKVHRSSESLSLARLWFLIQPAFVSMSCLAKFVRRASQEDAKGTKLLDIVNDFALSEAGNSKAREIFTGLLDAASAPLGAQVSDWIYRGIINDPFGEFFIRTESGGRHGEWRGERWERHYVIDEKRVPTLLKSATSRIFLAGKYLNVVTAIIGEPLHEKQKLSLVRDESRFQKQLDEALHMTSKRLLDLLLKEHGLMGKIDALKGYFLFHQGDRLNVFLELADDELAKPASNVSSNRLEGLLSLAFPGSEDLHVKMETSSIQAFVLLVLHTSGEEIENSQLQEAQRSVTFAKMDINLGYDAFSVDCDVEWPLSLVVTRSVQLKYQILFRHILQVKIIEKFLRRAWLVYSRSGSAISSVSHLLAKLLHFIGNLLSHFLLEVVELHWGTLKSDIATVETIDELLERHNDFLDKCLRDCMLTSKRLLMIQYKLLEICRNFGLAILGQGTTLRSPRERFSSEEMRLSVKTHTTDFFGKLKEFLSVLGVHSANNDMFLHFTAKVDYNAYYSCEEPENSA